MNMEHGGNRKKLAASIGLSVDALLDFSASINPLGPPEWLRAVVCAHLDDTSHYPDPECRLLLEAASDRYGVSPSQILAGNGSTELIYAIPRALQRQRAVIPVPSYTDYALAASVAGYVVEQVLLREQDEFVLDLRALEERLCKNDLVVIGRPNNPTGLSCNADDMRRLAFRHPDALFVVDEAFADFVASFDSLVSKRPPNVVVLLSLTKFFSIPGLRLGLAVGEESVMERIRKVMPPWSVNTMAQAAGEAALKAVLFAQQSVAYVAKQRESLRDELMSLPGLFIYPGEVNFLLVRMDRPHASARALAEKLLQRRIAIRVCDNFAGLDDRYFRVAVRTEEENAVLCGALRAVFGVAPRLRPKKKPAIMFQGTGSNVGKSVLAAAFCRILHQDGYRAAPFKAQNMSLNSFVTEDAGEMGRAQVVQAQACRIPPDVRMNPVLLKPTSDKGSQVVVLGKAIGNMEVETYIQQKPRLFRLVKKAYDSLADDCDVVVLEGAGSPAEVNLKQHDIVNMQMARYAQSPVLLVGDIDRGGVFASFIGTMEVLCAWERRLVVGYVINRFRGDERLLADAVAYTQRYTNKPTFGVVPYLSRLGLPEEDSVTFKNANSNSVCKPQDVEIAVIDLPHIANFTDFDAFGIEPDVCLRIVRSSLELGEPDAIILPGSKNVIADMNYLKTCGLAERISGLAQTRRTELVGICGGFQMLGHEVVDYDGIESGRKTKPRPGAFGVSNHDG